MKYRVNAAKLQGQSCQLCGIDIEHGTRKAYIAFYTRDIDIYVNSEWSFSFSYCEECFKALFPLALGPNGTI